MEGAGRKSAVTGKRILTELCLTVYDFLEILFSYFFALYLRFDFHFQDIPAGYLRAYRIFVPRYAFFAIVIFGLCRLYRNMWRHAGVNEFMGICAATVVTGSVHMIGITWLVMRMPVSYYLIGITMQFVLMMAARFGYRMFLLWKTQYTKKNVRDKEHVMIIGAGLAGTQVLRELMQAKEVNAECRCIIDDDKNKHGLYIKGVPVVGGRNKIISAAEEHGIDKILLCMPSADAKDKKELLEICKETGCELMILPGIYQLINEEVSVSKMRKVEIGDLLGREQVNIDLDSILSYVQSKTILVTGGGGSIGSELCRQIASHKPQKLIVFDIYENTAYDLQQELERNFKELSLEVLIGSVRNTHRVETVFEKYRPDIVFHAAAHKHVPLMENSPNEAIKNNVFGTLNCARAANRYGTKRFVLISTDKAVNPTNIMGATKRLCEMVIQAMAKTTEGTEYAAVRFGNVLGSNGSVIPLFKKQIEQGGPVTVTDKNIIRYFMTIPEAVSLVLQAGAYAKSGEIFVLDMGEAVRIDDLARNLIKLSGYKPDVDIEIKYTGLRPGEKLYEEMLMDEEGMQETENKLIHIGKPIEFDEKVFFEQLAELKEKAYEDNGEGRKMVQKMVPTYVYQG